jgi:glutamate dehydrogenase
MSSPRHVTPVETLALFKFHTMRRMISGGAFRAVTARSMTTAGLVNGVQNVLASRPGQLFDVKAIKSATDEFISFGFDGSYTKNFNAEQVAEHVYGYMCAKVADDTKGLSYTLEKELQAFYICVPKAQLETMRNVERFVKQRREVLKTHAFSLRSYSGKTKAGEAIILYDVRLVPFVDPSGKGESLASVASVDFMTSRTPGAVQRYEDLFARLKGAIAPVYNIKTLPNGVTVVNVGFISDREPDFLDECTSLITQIPGTTIVKKFVETFSNGQQVYSFYTKGASERDLADAVTMIGMMPERASHPYAQLYQNEQITAKEMVYAYSVSQFAYYFAYPATEGNYQALYKTLEKDAVLLKRLKNLRNSMFQELMDEKSISQVIVDNVALFKAMYADFEKGTTDASVKALTERIDKELPIETMPEFNALFKAILTFNRSVKATNFYKTNRAAVAYRLDPSFISHLDFPRVPFAIYMIQGAFFRGFHVRFHDIARGGVRLMLSRSNAEYKGKRKTLFQENYNLAYTQMLKNKDIPESGSKGTLLVSPRFDHQKHDPKVLFLQYTDALLDIMIPDTPGVRSTLPKRELLFLGPDENTAGDYPSAAAKHAKARGLVEWKSLTTGKSSFDGGIPHDVFGMTTNSVREYLLATYEALGWEQSKLVKFQTGGPDGDLGSNEILLGHEHQKAICDGSGSLYDPQGLNRDELVRLAKERKTVSHFDQSKLSKGGFFLSSTAPETTLPDGSVFTGSKLLATFHLTPYATADVFVPCGGRPNSITIDNVHMLLLDAPGVTGQMMLDGVATTIGPHNLKFKVISEGANLFITHEARIALENVGVILFKDSSANKGGVTSSSFEVYTGLAMADADHAKLMCCDARKPTEMYDALSKEIVQKIRDNARNEYNAITRDVKANALKGHRTMIADAYSNKMVDIFEFVSKSNLNQNEALFRYVLTQFTPKTLLKNVPLDVILKRVPRAYLEAIFHKQIAINYVYHAGASANEFSFFQYMADLQSKAETMFPNTQQQ